MSIQEYRSRIYYESVLLNAIQQCLSSYGSPAFPVRVEALLSILTSDLKNELSLNERNVLKPVEETRDYVKLSMAAKPVLDQYKLKYRVDKGHIYVYDTVHFRNIYSHYLNLTYRDILSEIINLLNRKGLLLKRRDLIIRRYNE